MVSFQAHVMKFFMRRTKSRVTKMMQGDFNRFRQRKDKLFRRICKPKHIDTRRAEVGQLHAEWIVPKQMRHPNRVMYYLHGGGYAAGSIYSHLGIMSRIANDCGLRILAIDYRLAPENPYPAALHDALAGYRYLIEEHHYRPEEIILMGDSAGGGLAAALLLYLKEQNLGFPLCSVLLSPWADLSLSGDSFTALQHRDPILPTDQASLWAQWYLAGQNPKNPLISPIFGDWQGLSPLMIQVGSEEILLSDSERLSRKALADGVEVLYECWQGMPHVWHMGWHYLPEARKALQKIAQFVDKQIQQHEQSQGQHQTQAFVPKPPTTLKTKTLDLTRDSLAAVQLGAKLLKNWRN